jgi:hypothetical protein
MRRKHNQSHLPRVEQGAVDVHVPSLVHQHADAQAAPDERTRSRVR